MEKKDNVGLVISFISRDAAGNIDHEASVENFRATLLRYEAERETESEQIGTLVTELFDTYRGAAIDMGSIESYVSNRLSGGNPTSAPIFREKTANFIRNSAPDWKAKMKADEAKQAGFTYFIGRGRNGGVVRLCDYTKPEKK